MQLTDAEIREILIRKKREKIRRQKRRRRRTILVIILLIALVFALVRILGRTSGNSSDAKDGDSSAAAGETRGIIFIDPGHGGADPGSDDDHDRYEKDDTLKLSLAVRDHLQAAGFQVEMSRTEDESVERAQRGQMANNAGAQLFISIHRNKADTDGNGVEGFIPRTDDPNSRLLGENIMHALGAAGFAERTIRAGTLNSAEEDYEEIAGTTMPSVLIEVGFLSSPVDNALFDDNLDRNAKVIADAVNQTFMTLYEPEKAAEYAAQLAEAEGISSQAAGVVKEAADETALIMDFFSEEDSVDNTVPEDESSGIDPEA